MRIELTVQEALDLAQLAGGLPSFLRSVTSEGDDILFIVDLRRIPDAPSSVRLAARLVPLVRGTLRIVSFTAGTLVLSVQASAGGLPAHKLLGFLEGPLGNVLRSQGFPSDAVRMLPGAHVAIDVQALLAVKLSRALPGLHVTAIEFRDGTMTAVAAL